MGWVSPCGCKPSPCRTRKVDFSRSDFSRKQVSLFDDSFTASENRESPEPLIHEYIAQGVIRTKAGIYKEKPWIPRIKCGAGSVGVYPDENRGRINISGKRIFPLHT